jgi:alpha-tubulin suppressor-like RCC1 family protein
MRFRLAVSGLAFLQRCGWFPFFFHELKRALTFCLKAGLLPALLVPSAVAQSSTNIPIFQFAVFYNPDLEINPGVRFTINGRVHSNTNIWATGKSSAEPLTFLDSVDAAGIISTNPSPLDPLNYDYRSGHVVFPAGSPIAHYGKLNLPLGASTTNYTYAAIESLLKMPPANYALGTAAAYTTSGQVYFANKADLIITNDAATGTNLTVLYQNQYNSSNCLIMVPPDATNIFVTGYTTNPITHVVTTLYATNRFYSYVTNVTFYDYREHDTVKALQIDVGKLDAWLGNTNSTGGWQYELINTDTANGTSKGHVINSIFVFNSLPTNSSQLPAVRVVNGAQLPNISPGGYPASGLGIATAMPIYVKGHYNVTTNGVNFAYTLGSTTNGNTLPAALLGDSITILSTSWSDAYNSGTALSSRGAVSTTINAACFQGIVPSDGTYYSGGLENSLRLLENWNGDTLAYNGSFVVMFPSFYATGHWDGAVYGVPTRQWGFDANFLNLSKLPPLTPSVVDNTTNPPVITTQPQNQTVVQGSNATFNITAAGFLSLSYQWKFNGTNISAATNTSLTLTNVQFSQAGNYAVLVTNAFGSTLSSNAVLTVVAQSPTIQTQPANQTVFVNGAATFGVTAAGSLPLNYQWNFNGTDIDGAINASLALANVQTNQAGIYTVQVTNAFGSILSSNAVLTVIALPPIITAQPTNQTVTVGYTANFSVTATGSLPLYYQWSFSGTDIIEATNAFLVLTNVQIGQAGNYKVQVTNLFGSTNSAAAVLLVGLQPTIIIQPTNQILMAGDTAIFNVTAGGSMPLNYQWRLNGTNLIWATNALLVLTNAQFEQSGNYAVQVANAFGSITSSNAVLSVIPLSPVILTQPTDVTVGVGDMATFTVSAGGTLPLSYQWQKNGFDLTDGGDVSGATTTNLVLTNVQTNNMGYYSVVVTNNLGAVTSRMAALKVNNAGGYVVAWGAGTNDSGYPSHGQSMVPPGLTNVMTVAGGQYHSAALKNDGTVVCWGQNTYGQTSVPAGLNNVVAISAGSMHTLALKSDGTVVAWGFDWNGQTDVPAGLNNVVAIAAGDTDSLALKSDGTTVSWGWNNQGQGNPMNNLAAITAGGQFSLGLKRDSTVVGWGGNFYGQTVVPAGLSNVVAIAAGGYHGLALKGDGTVVGWGSIWNGQNYVSVTVPAGLTNIIAIAEGWSQSLALKDDGTVVVWGYNAWGQTNIPAGLCDVVNIAGGHYHCLAVVNDSFHFLPRITTQPSGCTNNAGTTATFIVSAGGTLPLSCQWMKDGSNLTDGRNVSGATTTNLVLSNVQTNDAGTYAVVVTNLYGSVLSSNAVLTVLVPPSIATQPAGCTNVVGTTANFNIVADGTAPLTYQWQSNGTNLIDATNATLALNSVTLDQAGSYSVNVANLAGSITSSNAVLSVYATAAATLGGYSFSGVNGFQFTVAGVPGFNYAVQESTNLIDWVSLLTNTAPFIFVDANATNFPQQFYRTLYVP